MAAERIVANRRPFRGRRRVSDVFGNAGDMCEAIEAIPHTCGAHDSFGPEMADSIVEPMGERSVNPLLGKFPWWDFLCVRNGVLPRRLDGGGHDAFRGDPIAGWIANFRGIQIGAEDPKIGRGIWIL